MASVTMPGATTARADQVKDLLFTPDTTGKLQFRDICHLTKAHPNIPDILEVLRANGFNQEAVKIDQHYKAAPTFSRSQFIETIDKLFGKTHETSTPKLSEAEFIKLAAKKKHREEVVELAFQVSTELGESAAALLPTMNVRQFLELLKSQSEVRPRSPRAGAGEAASPTPSKASPKDQSIMLDDLLCFLTTLQPEEGEAGEEAQHIALQGLLGFIVQASSETLIDRAITAVSGIVPGIDLRLAEAASKGPVNLERFIQSEARRLAKTPRTLTGDMPRKPTEKVLVKPTLLPTVGVPAPQALGIGLPNGKHKENLNCFMWSILQVMFNTPNLHQNMVRYGKPSIRHLAIAYKRGQIDGAQAMLHGYNIRQELGMEWHNQNDATEVFGRGFEIPKEGTANPFVVPFSERIFKVKADGTEELTSDNLRMDSTPSHQLHITRDGVDVDELYYHEVTDRRFDTPTGSHRAAGSYGSPGPNQMIFTIQRAVGYKDTRDVNFKLGEDVILHGEVYRLKGYVSHQGKTMSGGHYISAKENDDGSWTYYNDDVVRRISAEEAKVELPQAVWVYYEKVGVATGSTSTDWTTEEGPVEPATMPPALRDELHARAAATRRKALAARPTLLKAPTAPAKMAVPTTKAAKPRTTRSELQDKIKQAEAAIAAMKARMRAPKG